MASESPQQQRAQVSRLRGAFGLVNGSGQFAATNRVTSLVNAGTATF